MVREVADEGSLARIIALTQLLRSIANKAFTDEDKPMIQGAQARMGKADFWSLKPLLLPIDKAAVLARRKLQKMVAAGTLAHNTALSEWPSISHSMRSGFERGRMNASSAASGW